MRILKANVCNWGDKESFVLRCFGGFKTVPPNQSTMYINASTMQREGEKNCLFVNVI